MFGFLAVRQMEFRVPAGSRMNPVSVLPVVVPDRPSAVEWKHVPASLVRSSFVVPAWTRSRAVPAVVMFVNSLWSEKVWAVQPLPEPSEDAPAREERRRGTPASVTRAWRALVPPASWEYGARGRGTENAAEGGARPGDAMLGGLRGSGPGVAVFVHGAVPQRAEELRFAGQHLDDEGELLPKVVVENQQIPDPSRLAPLAR